MLVEFCEETVSQFSSMSKVPLIDNQDLQVHLAILWYLTELDIVSQVQLSMKFKICTFQLKVNLEQLSSSLCAMFSSVYFLLFQFLEQTEISQDSQLLTELTLNRELRNSLTLIVQISNVILFMKKIKSSDIILVVKPKSLSQQTLTK